MERVAPGGEGGGGEGGGGEGQPVFGSHVAKRGRVAWGRALLQITEQLAEERGLRERLLAIERPSLSRCRHQRLQELDAPGSGASRPGRLKMACVSVRPLPASSGMDGGTPCSTYIVIKQVRTAISSARSFPAFRLGGIT